MSTSIDSEDWEKVDDFLSSTSSSVSHQKSQPNSSTARQGQTRSQNYSRRATAYRGTAAQPSAAAPTVMTRSPKVNCACVILSDSIGALELKCSYALLCNQITICVTQIWIAGILALSVFWCVVSLIAISRLETRLPSEMQEQLEFHASFSGLWPRSQSGVCSSVTNMRQITIGRMWRSTNMVTKMGQVLTCSKWRLIVFCVLCKGRIKQCLGCTTCPLPRRP